MIVRVTLLDDFGMVLSEREGNAMSPLDFKTPTDRPFEDKRFKFYGFVYQPIVVLKPLEPTR
jgi:hypothetical protein